MIKINGKMLGNKSYRVNKNGVSNSLKTILHADTGLKAGDKIYEFMRDDGVIEIIPEKIMPKNRDIV